MLLSAMRRGAIRATAVITGGAALSEEYPVFTREEISKRDGKRGETWVTYKDRVYDISDFVNAHPGGAQKIKLAAGQSVEPFWRIYKQHLDPAVDIQQILEPMRIGTLDASDFAKETTINKEKKDDDPYKDEPERHPALCIHTAEPCNAEAPVAMLGDPYLTPTELWYVRNHHPVPLSDGDSHVLSITTDHGNEVSLSVSDLKKNYDRTTVTATMQCSGNRRGHMNQYGKTSGTAWGSGAASTAEWAGVPLRVVVADLLFKDKSAPLSTAKALGASHVIFEAKDDMQASVPVEKALSELGDCLLAYEMNGAPIPRDHGGPLRAVVPGYAGVRNVKWVQKVKLSSQEAEGAWQRGMNYKAMPSHWRTKQDLQGVDFSQLPSIHELPVQCAFSSPAPGDSLPSDEESIEAKGWALGSAGRSIHRVEVSADGGETWVAADLEEGLDQPYGRAWAWTTWSAEVPVGSGPVELVARAHDLGGGAMPRTPADVWNIRGLNNNSWPVARLERS
jgi:sulfite oxidase